MNKEEKPKRAKKPVNVEVKIDTEHVDVNFKKDETGVSFDIEIDDRKEYEFESFGSQHMPKGTVWKVTGELLKIFLKRGIGKLKK
jgi:hypothetical protein